MTWHEWHRKCHGFEYRQELSWQRIRLVATLVYNSNSKKPITPEKLVPLNLDKKNKKEQLETSQADMSRILEKYKHLLTPQNGEQ